MGNLASKKPTPGQPRPATPSPPPVLPGVDITPPAVTVHEHLVTRMRRHGNKVAQVCAETGEEMTFESILQRSGALAAGLIARGLQQGDVAVVVGENSVHYPWVLLGIMHTGAAAHLLHSKSHPREVEHAITISKPKMALVSARVIEDENMRAVLRGCDSITQVLLWGSEATNSDLLDGMEQFVVSPARSDSTAAVEDPAEPVVITREQAAVDAPAEVPADAVVAEVPADAPSDEVADSAEGVGRQSPCVMVGERDMAAGGSTAPPPTPTSIAPAISRSGSSERCPFVPRGRAPSVQVAGDAVALLLSSSGSTGLPKAVMLTHANVLAALEQESTFMTPDDVMVGVCPYSHAYGGVLMLMALTVGTRVVAMGRFSLPRLVAAVERHRATVLHVVPSLLTGLSKMPTIQYDSARMSSLRRIWTGAALVSPLLQTEIKGRLPGVTMYHSYGMTETTFTVFTGEAFANRPGSPGKLVKGMQCKIIDDSGAVVRKHTIIGEMCFKGDMLMKGYLNNPRATAENVDSNGWLHSGDLGYYDKEGYYYIVDRMKDVFKFNGHQICPTELEALLVTHQAVQEAAVVGVPHPYGEAAMALIVVAEGYRTSAEDITRYIAERVSSYKQLHGGVRFVTSFPRTVSGKLQRKKLKALVDPPATSSSSLALHLQLQQEEGNPRAVRAVQSLPASSAHSPTHEPAPTADTSRQAPAAAETSAEASTETPVVEAPASVTDELTEALVRVRLESPPQAGAEAARPEKRGSVGSPPPASPSSADLTVTEEIQTFHTPNAPASPTEGDRYGSPMVLRLTPATPPKGEEPGPGSVHPRSPAY